MNGSYEESEIVETSRSCINFSLMRPARENSKIANAERIKTRRTAWWSPARHAEQENSSEKCGHQRAAGSNLSPLNLLLGLMREPNLPLELRISVAHEALPYVHSKQQDCDRPRAGKYGARGNGVNAEPHPDSGPRVKTAKVSVAAPQRDDGPEVTPLGFLLGVMRDADTPPHLRIRVAGMVAPYVHAKRVTADPSENPVETTVVVDDPYGFKIDPPSHGRLGMTSSGWSVCGPLKDIPIETRLLQRWPRLKLASPK